MEPFSLAKVTEIELGDAQHSVVLRTWFSSEGRPKIQLPKDWTHFGFSTQGNLTLKSAQLEASLRGGGFFRIPGSAEVSGVSGFTLSMAGMLGCTHASGPFSSVKLEKYLPGGAQNCLIWPAQISGPTLNTLQMDQNTIQDEHEHDSIRINVIIQGKGKCIIKDQELCIKKGDVVVIPANHLHQFITSTDSLTFVAFHPDSDETVFSDTKNPMILKTFVKSGGRFL